jgi:hypothetical protein
MGWTAALWVFIAQLLCCILVEGKLKRYLPTIMVAALMAVTLLFGTFGIISAVLLLLEAKLLLMGFLAIGIYHLANWIKK